METEGHGYKTFSYCSKIRHDQDRLAIAEVKQGIRSKCSGMACLYTLVEHLLHYDTKIRVLCQDWRKFFENLCDFLLTFGE